MAELREILSGRRDGADLLAEVASVMLGFREGTPDEPRPGPLLASVSRRVPTSTRSNAGNMRGGVGRTWHNGRHSRRRPVGDPATAKRKAPGTQVNRDSLRGPRCARQVMAAASALAPIAYG